MLTSLLRTWSAAARSVEMGELLGGDGYWVERWVSYWVEMDELLGGEMGELLGGDG